MPDVLWALAIVGGPLLAFVGLDALRNYLCSRICATQTRIWRKRWMARR